MNFGIKARKAIKKVAALSAGAAMIGSTLFGAVAADLTTYPDPFVEDGMWNTVIVVGADAASGDVAGAIDISATLSQQATTAYETTTTTTTVEGGVALASGNDKVFLGDTLGEAGLTTITEDEFPTILSDGTFTDDAGNEYDYSQKIEIGDTTNADFEFDTSGNDLDDPALIIDLGTNPTNPIYDLVIDFDEETNLSGTDSKGEEITIFGKTYTIGSSSTTTKLQLLGGATEVTLDWGETKTVTFQGEDYELTLIGVQDDDPNEATLTINGDTETVGQGRTKKIGGVEVYADTVNYYGLDAYPGDAIISLGADELWLEDSQEVSVGSDEDDIDGTDVSITSTNNNEDVTQIKISISAQDDDYDHMAIGDSFEDPVFGTVKLTFADAVNGPDITEGTGVDANDARRLIHVTASDKNTLQVELTDANGDTDTFEWAYDDTPAADSDPILADSDGNTIAVYEGATLDEESGTSGGAVYTILNSGGEYSGMIEIDNLDDDDMTDADLDIKDVITGDTIISWDNQDLNNSGSGKDFTYRGKTYTALVDTNAGGVTIVDSTAGSTTVYPYIGLYSGYEHKVALIEPIEDFYNATGNTSQNIILPTGTAVINTITNSSGIKLLNATYSGTGVQINGSGGTLTVGTLDYTFNCDQIGPTHINWSMCNVSLGGTGEAGLLVVGEEDTTNSDAKEYVYFETNDTAGDDNSDITLLSPDFSSARADNDQLDDSDLTAYIDAFGIYVLRDVAGDQDEDTMITVPQQQMYASVFIAPEEATTTTTSATAGVTIHSVSGVDVAKLDTEVTDKTSKPMILVGGPCVNDLVAELAADGGFRYGCADWPGSNFGIIELAENAFGGTNMAIVVAGTRAEDTRRACKVLKDFDDYTLSGDSMKVTGTTTTPVVEPYVEETE